MKITTVDVAALRAEHGPERRGRHWVCSCQGLGTMVNLPLGLGIVQRGRGELSSGGKDRGHHTAEAEDGFPGCLFCLPACTVSSALGPGFPEKLQAGPHLHPKVGLFVFFLSVL